ncbi:MAG: PilT/PilU family type 4a pilus ATPase [Acidobacteria bacterium]|jgi:twitching motility protein PilT|nr:PilT/PilU family type 4a pilus ATPase [Acidobacteriota bacterium]
MATTAQPPARPATAFDRFNAILKEAVNSHASDVHISVGSGFRLRQKGEIIPAPDAQPLAPSDVGTIVAGIALAGRKTTRENVGTFVQNITDFDCSYSLPEVGRFRVNVCCQRGTLSLVLRHIPFQIPDFMSLRLPAVMEKIAMMDRGLVLLTGTTGSGKSTTLAAMVNYVNKNKKAKIVTIEDPIEFMYKDQQANIVQREVGSDTESFGKALRAALRQDPDIILVGEMRDTETVDIAIKAAETGHLVFSTVHTTDAPKTVLRLLSVFPPEEQATVRIRLSETLQSVISQRLLPRADGGGRCVACEIMRHTKSIQDCIADPDKTDEMKDYIEKGKEMYGMQTFDQHLTELYLAKIITLEVAKHAATSPADFERNLQFQ